MLTQADKQRRLLTVDEVAQRLRVHPGTVRRMLVDGRLLGLQLGGPGSSIRIDERELHAWLYNQGDDAA